MFFFNKKYNFSIEDKQSLSYKLYSANTINPEFEIKDDNAQNIGIFKPKIIIVTSYYDMYQKQYDNIDKNIESYQSKINQLSETLDDISLPYRAEFEKNN